MSAHPLTVLVTGGAGYIGSHTTHQLLAAGHRVSVIDTLYSGHRWAVPDEVDFHQLDAGDSDAVTALIRARGFDAVIHFAGHIVVPESVANPAKYYQNNVVASLKLIESCQQAGVECFIFSSSAAVYGNPQTIPVDESAPVNPINPYGRTKLITEWTLADLARRADSGPKLRYIALRYFNVAGARLDGRLGQATPEATHLIKVGCEAACGLREAVSIFGTDYETTDGTCIRDYIHVEDLAGAHLQALDYLADGGKSRVLNCGYGHGYSVREVLDTLRRISEVNFTIRETDRRAGDPACLVSDNRAIREVLDWAPQYDDLELICSSALDWEHAGNLPTAQKR
ncbi:MAG: UDP-glucose 4-epimerase GalE [Arenicellales bacterium]